MGNGKDQPTLNYSGLAHLATFSMIITDDGAFAIASLSRVYFEGKQLVVCLMSRDIVKLSETATAQFLEQTQIVAQTIQRQTNSQILTPGKVIRH